MQITDIKPQKSGKRINIFLDGKFSFGIDLENFVNFGLKVDQELTEAEVEEIIKKAEFQKTLDKLLKFATLRPRSEREFKDYLKRKKVHESIHNELFNRLKRLELMDDRKFAQWWVEQRNSFRPKPKSILYKELCIKGINREIIRKILEELKVDESKIAKELLEKKSYRWDKLAKVDKNKARQKAAQFLARKGFAWEIVDRVVREVVK